ncbi:MAG: conserved repeat domain-containing protein [Candidatus Nitrotoga sp. LAW]|nr:MAG: conserved repeat domain-containing protein [Candidatus Nitrotoga sp. LAW]
MLAGSKIYADGCQWVNDPTDVITPIYRECLGSGKYGGSTTLTYVVEVKTGAAALASTGVSINALLYDFSGSSYHYNADQSAAVTFNFTNNPPPAEVDLAMAKSAVLSSPGNGDFTLTVTNTGSISATNVVVTDNVPDGYNIKTSQPAAPAGTTLVWDKTDPNESLVWTISSLPAGSSISYTFSVQTVNNQTNYVNQACVAATQTDPNTTNNCATAAVPVAQSDLALVKTASFTSPLKIGDSITFNVGVLNLGPNVGTGVVVSDTLPAGYSFTSASCASGWTLSNVGATHSCTATSNVAVSAVPATILSIVAQVLAPADPTVTTGYQNTASVTSTSNDPVAFNNQASAVASPTFLTIAKVADAVSYTSASPNGTYTLTVTKSGSSANLGVISVQDVLPLGVSATSITGVGWTCSLATLICTRADDLTSGIPPSAVYPDIVIGVTFSGPSNADVVNYANVISESGGIVTSYDETTRSVSWTNSAVYYTADATASPGGGGSAACSPSSVPSGSNSVCTATPNTGYYFIGWTGACAAVSTNLTCNLNNVTANQSSVATFALLTYTVVATAGTGGSANCVPSPVSSGSNSVCTATPSTGYYFTGWTGACAAASTNLTCNLNNVTANQSSVATFALLTYTVVATAGAGGSASCAPSPVSAGGTATCTATADAGSTFTGWTGACAGQSGLVCNLTGIAANMASTASFTATVTAGSLQAIPALSGWLMIMMVFLMVLAACAAIRRKQE